jgi:twitching motility protein PilT
MLISSLHTPDATTTIARIVAMFSPEEQDTARSRLADSLHAIVSQRLLPREDEDGGRCPALEIMVCTPEIRELIRDRSRVGEIKDLIADGRDQHGMQTFDQHLIDLVEGNVVTPDAAKAAATNPAEFEKKLEKPRKKSKTE